MPRHLILRPAAGSHRRSGQSGRPTNNSTRRSEDRRVLSFVQLLATQMLATQNGVEVGC
jgi:hypothetical protein